jgi:multidrug efflux pump subunit AcrB
MITVFPSTRHGRDSSRWRRTGTSRAPVRSFIKQFRKGGSEGKASFPKGLDYNIGYNPTEFIAQSVSELIKTIYEAMVLVVIVVLVFLQGWRPAIIPIVAIPVSLIGTFAAMAALGFAINNLTLFGLVLAVGIVVDDAIVVVKNVEWHLRDGMSRRDAALKTMEEVGGALVSIALVLCAVFVPTAFLGGISGQFFQQFAIMIAVATAISCFCSLTLLPRWRRKSRSRMRTIVRRRAGISSGADGRNSPESSTAPLTGCPMAMATPPTS